MGARPNKTVNILVLTAILASAAVNPVGFALLLFIIFAYPV